MSAKGKYKTKQREEILTYLRSIPGVHFTAADVSDHFRNAGSPVGMATIYRTLEVLTSEGMLNKYIIDAGTPACFEYIEKDVHCHHDVCFHCKCEECGKLYHMNTDEMVSMQKSLEQKYHFSLDLHRTVFYGICADCQKSI